MHNGNINQEFRKLTDELGIHREGVGFYALRHMFATIGRRAGDKEIVDYVMGHASSQSEISSTYVAYIERERLQKVADAVCFWLWPEKAPGAMGASPALSSYKTKNPSPNVSADCSAKHLVRKTKSNRELSLLSSWTT